MAKVARRPLLFGRIGVLRVKMFEIGFRLVELLVADGTLVSGRRIENGFLMFGAVVRVQRLLVWQAKVAEEAEEPA